MSFTLRTIILSALMLLLLNIGQADGDATRGERLYNSRCIACHSLDANRVGPMHRGVFGREAGSVPDYEYSAALAGASLHWSAELLDRWLQNPETLIPGQRMNFSVPSAEDRADIIAFFKRGSKK